MLMSAEPTGRRRPPFRQQARFLRGILPIDAIQKQHVEMDVKIERRSKPLDQRDSAGAGRLVGKPGLPDQVGGDDAVDDAEHLADSRNQAVDLTGLVGGHPEARSLLRRAVRAWFDLLEA